MDAAHRTQSFNGSKADLTGRQIALADMTSSYKPHGPPFSVLAQVKPTGCCLKIATPGCSLGTDAAVVTPNGPGTFLNFLKATAHEMHACLLALAADTHHIDADDTCSLPLAGSVSTSSAPNALRRILRSRDMEAGMVSTSLYPRAAAMKARPMPVFPDVGSTRVVCSNVHTPDPCQEQ